MSSEWNKIDLHIHSQHGITYDRKKKDGGKNYFNPINFCLRNIFNDLKLVSITNHNVINIIELLKIRYCSKKYSKTEVLPGLELDVLFNDKKDYHIIIIFSNRVNIVSIAYELDKYVKQRMTEGSNIYLNFNEFINLIVNTECIIIPHACKKNGMKEGQDSNISSIIANDILSMINNGNFINILFEHTRPYFAESFAKNVIERSSYNWVSNDDLDKIIAENPQLCAQYTASDYRFRNDITGPEERDFTSIWSEPSYRGFELACLFCKTRIKPSSKIIDRSNFIKRIIINKNKYFDDSDISLSSGLNSIVGNSASGKTTLLHIIAKKLNEKRIKKDKDFSFTDDLNVNFYDKDNKPLMLNDINIEISSAIYDEIKTIHETNNKKILELFGYKILNTSNVLTDYEEKVQKYVDYYTKYYNSMNSIKENIGLFNENIINLINNYPKADTLYFSINPGVSTVLENTQTNISNVNDKVLIMESGIKNLKQYFNDIKFNLKDLNIETNIGELINNEEIEIIKIKEKLSKEYLKNQYLILKYKKINQIIEKFNKQLGLKSEYIERIRKNIISSKFKINHEILLYVVNNIKCNETNLDFPRNDIMYDLDKKNKNEYIELETVITDDDLKLNKDSSFLDISGNTTILKELKGKVIEKDQNIKECINILIDNEKPIIFRNDLFLDEIISKSIIKIGYPNEEKMNILDVSPGDNSKIYLDYKFNNTFKNGLANVILFDQPENDVDKEFIYDTLLEKICDLKQETQVIITSHDPLIVINGDSNRIIQTIKKKDNNEILIKYNSFSLEEYCNENPVTDVICKFVDGHVKAIKDRYNLYEGGKQQWK